MSSPPARSHRRDPSSPRPAGRQLEGSEVALDRAGGYLELVGELLRGAATRAGPAQRLARGTGVAVIFEAKVLSDVSTHITFDVARNQLARTIDVMLEANPSQPPLCLREPKQTFLVLLTPALMQAEGTGNAASGSRLYGWLMPALQGSGWLAPPAALPHRDGAGIG